MSRVLIGLFLCMSGLIPVGAFGASKGPNVCVIDFHNYSVITSSCDGEPATEVSVDWQGDPKQLTQLISRELSKYYDQGLHLISGTVGGSELIYTVAR